jgi:hypothetical protein
LDKVTNQAFILPLIPGHGSEKPHTTNPGSASAAAPVAPQMRAPSRPQVSPYQANFKHRLSQQTIEKLERKESLDSVSPNGTWPSDKSGIPDAKPTHAYPLMTLVGADLGTHSPFKFDPERGTYRYVKASLKNVQEAAKQPNTQDAPDAEYQAAKNGEGV